jgi:hypothetical protein
MPKLGVTINDDMETALTRHAKKRGAPLAYIVREALKEWLEKHGDHVTTEVAWGGDRRPEHAQNKRKDN